MKNDTGILATMAGAVIAFFFLTVYTGFKFVLVPVLRLAVCLILKGMKKGGSATCAVVMSRKAKAKPVVKALPTPDVFKGMQNLAPAKELRLR